ncbi:hypothetical protein [Streptomyces sp. NPDC001492]
MFATAGPGGTSVDAVVFLAGVAVRCFALSRRGHVVLPSVLITLGLPIPIEGGAGRPVAGPDRPGPA